MERFDDLYVLKSTDDNTDRTSDIERELSEKGVCFLGHGVFCVSGIKMPDNSSLVGFGEGSVLLLDESVDDGFAVKMGCRTSIKNLVLVGKKEDIVNRPSEIGKRHGILFSGNATLKDWSGQVQDCIINSCQIRSFSGGGITCVDTGYSTSSCLVASDCHITGCGVGINISHYSEYHKFTNMHCVENNYGCINNGGNNVFCACGFDSNTVGFMIDNTEQKSPNNSHGSAVGCTFNHSDHNKGIGIHIIGADNGFVFSGCQVFYSKIVLENSSGIQLCNLNCGRCVEFYVKGGKTSVLSDSIFFVMPTVIIEDNPLVRIYNCYTYNGEEVTVASN